MGSGSDQAPAILDASASGLLRWFKESCARPGLEGLMRAFRQIAGTHWSIREYWLQLQLQYMVEVEPESSREWEVLDREPPPLYLDMPGRDKKNKDLKWPDLLLFRRKPPGDQFLWWELKWISDRDRFRRFIADACLLRRVDVRQTARAYANSPSPGEQLAELLRRLGLSSKKAGSAIQEVIEKAAHRTVSFATVTDEELLQDWKGLVALGPAGWIEEMRLRPRVTDFPRPYRDFVAALMSETSAKARSPGCEFAGDRLDLSNSQAVGLLVWTQVLPVSCSPPEER